MLWKSSLFLAPLFALLRFLALTNSYGANYEILSLITLICDLASSLRCGKMKSALARLGTQEQKVTNGLNIFIAFPSHDNFMLLIHIGSFYTA